MTELSNAEIPYEDGAIRYRYARYLNEDGTRWIRHGLFRAYHPNGELASEGHYTNGHEHGLWKDFHQNGQIAAQGEYDAGREIGHWQYWNDDGTPNSEAA